MKVQFAQSMAGASVFIYFVLWTSRPLLSQCTVFEFDSQKRGEVWRHVIMVALFLDDNKTNDDDGKEFGKKWYVYINKQQLARTSRYFVHFFAVVAPLRHETS